MTHLTNCYLRHCTTRLIINRLSFNAHSVFYLRVAACPYPNACGLVEKGVYRMARSSTDRRVIRTKMALRSVLGELVEEKGLDAITVSDLTERADINRGTFYLHYRDKNDLIESLEDEIVQEVLKVGSGLRHVSLEEVYSAHENNTALPFAVALFDYLRQNGMFMRALLGPKGDPGFRKRFQDAVTNEIIPGLLNTRYLINMTALTRYYISFYTGATLGLIMQWLDTGMRESSDEMARIIVNILFLVPGDAIEMPGYSVPGKPVEDASATRDGRASSDGDNNTNDDDDLMEVGR